MAGKLMFPGEVGGKLMLSEGRPPALPGPMRMGVSTSWEAMPLVGVRAPCLGVAAPTLGERAGLDISLELYIYLICPARKLELL